MNIAYHFDAVPDLAIQDQVISDRKVSATGSDVIARHAHLRSLGECKAPLVESIENPVCCVRVVTSDVSS